MKHVRRILFGLLCITGALTGRSDAADYDHIIRLSDISFEWRLDAEFIHIRLAARASGWIAIGFNTDGWMQGADLIIGYVKNGKAEVQDHFGIRGVQHIADKRNGGRDDITQAGGKEAGGLTTIWFTIPLDSGDENDHRIDTEGMTSVLLAFGPGRDDFTSRHRYRNVLQVHLASGAYR
jgi:hypothetical protein